MISKQDRDVYFEMGINPIKAPCVNCTKRTAECHIKGNCYEYDKYKIKSEAYRRVANHQKAVDKRFYEHRLDFIRRIK